MAQIKLVLGANATNYHTYSGIKMAKGSTDSPGLKLALVGVVGAVIGAVVTGGFNYLAHQGDLDGKMIELSAGILRSEPTPGTEPLREWAIDVMEKRARFSFNAAQRTVLLKTQLPAKGIAFSSDDTIFYSPPEPKRTPNPKTPVPRPPALTKTSPAPR